MSSPISQLVYQPSQYPQWGLGGFSTAKATRDELAPESQDFNTGYDSTTGRLNQARRNRVLKHANANFCDGQYQFPLFVHNVSMDMALAGQTAQSQLTRDFYPHNFVLPSFKITGQCYDQTSYGMLCEFIHQSQRQPLVNGPHQMQLYVRGNARPNVRGTRSSNIGVTYQPGNGKSEFIENQIIKGQNQPIICLGYTMTMMRDHHQGDYAPVWEMDFMVVRMIAGPYTDSAGSDKAQTDWTSLLGGTPNSSTTANRQEAAKAFKNAAKTSLSLTNTVISSVGG